MRLTLFGLVLAGLAVPCPAAEDERLALDGIAHVALRVEDVAKSRAFLEKLGWQQAFEFGDTAGVRVSYVKINDRQFIELYRKEAPTEKPGLMHICLQASGLDRVQKAYTERGLTTTDYRKAKAGNMLFNLRDPEKQLIEYTEYLPGSMHSEDKGKHLGDGRISERLMGVEFVAKDPGLVREFYATKLGFRFAEGDADHAMLTAPGGSGEFVVIEDKPGDWRPQLFFRVADLKRTAKLLQGQGIEPTTAEKAIEVRDADGFSFIFSLR